MSTAASGARSPGVAGMPRAGRWTVAVIAAMTLLGACADEDGVEPIDEVGVGEGEDGPAEEVPLGGEDPTLANDGVDPERREEGFEADLEITAGTEDDEELSEQAILSCGEDGATGVLWLEGEAAEAACRTLEDEALMAVLGPAEDGEECPDLDGGSEVATIVGTVDGRQVDTVIRRDDGCGVERWDALGPLLPDPEDLGAAS